MKEKDFTTDKITISSYLTKLRQLTLDPSILIEGYTGGSGKIDVTVELIEDFIKEKHKTWGHYKDDLPFYTELVKANDATTRTIGFLPSSSDLTCHISPKVV